MQVEPKNIAMGKESLLQDEKPNPPRFWWLKRGAIGFGLLLALLCVLRFWWGHEAQRRTDALAREAHARGEPFYPEDYRQEPVPDAENAAVPIQAAVKKLQTDGLGMAAHIERAEFFGWSTPGDGDGDDVRPAQDEVGELGATVHRYGAALRLVRLARGRTKVAFSEPPARFESTYYRPLGQFLVMAANYEHATGDDGEAVEHARDALMLVEALKQCHFIDPQDRPTIHHDAINLLKYISSDLSISKSAGHGASPRAVQSLIAALLDDRQMPAYICQAGEDDFGYIWGAVANGMAIKLLAPMDDLDLIRFEETDAPHEATFQAAKASWKDFPSNGNQSVLAKIAHPIASNTKHYPAELSIGGYYKVLTERRVVATILAIQLYKFDHRNKLPESLVDLVPTYLPAVPCDPFDPANGPIRYLPKRDPPELYSIGFNGKDDGGSEKFVVFFRRIDPRWLREDVIFPLRPPPPSPVRNHQVDEQE